ncbi:MAG: hypothetical protein NVSMB5_21260 [Candidatus Velthaea sp.]
MKLLNALAALTALLALPLTASAADTDMDSANAANSNYGVVVCRVAKSGEKINARMVNRATSLVCKPIDPQGSMATIAMVKAKSPSKFGPNLSAALTPDQVNRAWQRYIDKTFMIDHTP